MCESGPSALLARRGQHPDPAAGLVPDQPATRGRNQKANKGKHPPSGPTPFLRTHGCYARREEVGRVLATYLDRLLQSRGDRQLVLA